MSHLNDDLHNRMPRLALWIDTSDLTEDQTVDSILGDLDQAVIAE